MAIQSGRKRVAEKEWLGHSVPGGPAISSDNADAIVGSGIAIRQVVGALDWVLDMNLDFHKHLVATGIAHDLTVVPDVGHSVMPLFGDLNGDRSVDGADLGILLNDWGGSGPGDLNDDGTVDGADLGLLLNAWTG